jgi:predicted nucleotidyltransferase
VKNSILKYLKEIKPKLESNGIIKLGLFGSYAKDKQSKNSDIDIVYESSDIFINKFKGWVAFTYLNENLREKIQKEFGINVDMFDLNSNSLIKEKIKKEAIYV